MEQSPHIMHVDGRETKIVDVPRIRPGHTNGLAMPVIGSHRKSAGVIDMLLT